MAEELGEVFSLVRCQNGLLWLLLLVGLYGFFAETGGYSVKGSALVVRLVDIGHIESAIDPVFAPSELEQSCRAVPLKICDHLSVVGHDWGLGKALVGDLVGVGRGRLLGHLDLRSEFQDWNLYLIDPVFLAVLQLC